MSTHVNYDNIRSLLMGVGNNLATKIADIDLTDQQKSQLALIDKILKSGDGSKYLSDNGTYKNIPLDKIGSMNDNIKTIYDLLKITTQAEKWDNTGVPNTYKSHSSRAVSYKDKIYNIGGWDDSYPLNTNKILNTITNVFTTGESMPTPRGMHGCVQYNGCIYCIGGACYVPAIVYNKIEVYDTTSNTWSTSYNSMPTSRQGFGCIVYNDKIYCIGGSNSNGTLFFNKVEIYDIITNTWSVSNSNIPISVTIMGCVTYNGKIYCIGGYNGSYNNISNSLYIYDILSNTWTTGSNMPYLAASFPCILDNEQIYCVSGYGNGYINKVAIYNISKNIWSIDPIPTAIAAQHFGFAVSNKKLYLFGGTNGGNALSSVYVWYIPTTQYNITLPSDISNKLSLLITNGTGNKLLTDNGTYQEYIPSGYRELTTDELNTLSSDIKSSFII